ncbi:hypothetical protein NDU88_004493 [Pleurodeles waltl]|uniref:Uncharacterized protein n=1 Tax=Pleurodeles waltl TaxID=8319 RepID=A0AAV7MUQ4_PLEWA|nr:hypothetical protein NDU88_004493 [Pleurodeles waltl]
MKGRLRVAATRPERKALKLRQQHDRAPGLARLQRRMMTVARCAETRETREHERERESKDTTLNGMAHK